MLERAAESVESAGYELGHDVSWQSMSPPVISFKKMEATGLMSGLLSPEEMIDLLERWKDRFPLISIEDGLSEDDWEHWPILRKRLGEETLTLADDLTCTNPDRIARAIQVEAANALLLKVNQIGTVTEAKSRFSTRQAGRMEGVGERAKRRNRGPLAGRPRSRLVRRLHQSRVNHAIRTTGEIQSAFDDRRRWRDSHV